ncbi:MAG: DUF1318 domain-containing protein [Lentisphaeria bacterium]|jgi:uncharacterized protein YdbL (DUF1318 family)|nr:YdbL family protein [Lentisphaeria bacterium]MDD6337297.1 DUF1318 domain-containing protein [Lentisphaeria bacterium]
MKKFLAISLAIFACAIVAPQFAFGADSATIKKNMAERKPKIETLKKAGSIGENKAGYLEAMKDAKLSEDDSKLIEAENADRKTVYTAVAKQEKTTVEKVGEIRAKQIRSKANEGDFIQEEDGKWVKAPKPAPKDEKKDEKKDK